MKMTMLERENDDNKMPIRVIAFGVITTIILPMVCGAFGLLYLVFNLIRTIFSKLGL